MTVLKFERVPNRHPKHSRLAVEVVCLMQRLAREKENVSHCYYRHIISIKVTLGTINP